MTRYVQGTPIKDLEAMGEKFFTKLGVDKETDPLKAARALPPEKIMEAGDNLSRELIPRDFRDSAIDGHFLTDAPANIFRSSKQNPVPVITCANLGELTGPGTLLMPFLIPDYVNILNGVNGVGQKGYACIFDQVPRNWRNEGCVSTHAMEVGYVFGDWDDSAHSWPFLFTLAKGGGAKTPDPGLTEIDKKVSEGMMAMWVRFARNGNPNIEGRIIWPAYSSETDQYLYIAEPLQVKSGFSKVAQKQ
jgi:para-nitrobenzyl esterase